MAARRCDHWRRRLLWLALALGLFLKLLGSAQAREVGEYDVKAAFLLNFAKYVEWPAAVLPSPMTPLEVCVLGNDPFGDLLHTLVKARSTNERPILLRRPGTVMAARECQIVFINHASPVALRRDLAQLRDSPVLTVGESPHFLAAGGIVAFRLEENRVRLTVDLSAARRAQLKISSRLLALAEVVE
jgi:hypothetical protein